MQEKTNPSVSFEKVLTEELKEIRLSRKKRLGSFGPGDPQEEAATVNKAHKMKLIGLAFSGGGIRSATFNLGIIQGLAELKILKRFDYLSTVSGGGYIGSWLTAWIKREKSIDKVQEKLSSRVTTGSKSEEHRPVFFLRQYSNYLTPKAGLFSGDTWAAVSTYLRNLTLNLGVFFPLFLAILLLPILMVSFFDAFLFHSNLSSLWLFMKVVIPLGIGGFFISANLMYQPGATGKAPWYVRESGVLFSVVLPIIISSLLGALWLWRYGKSIDLYWGRFLLIAGGFFLFFWLMGWFNAQLYAVDDNQEEDNQTIRKSSSRAIRAVQMAGNQIRSMRQVTRREIVMCSISLAASAGLWVSLLIVSKKLLGILNPADPTNIWYIIAIGMPLIILVYMAVATLLIGLMGRDATEEMREWWSRLGGQFFIVMFGWLGLFGIIIAGPPILVLGKRLGILLIGSGWLSSTIAGILLGKSSLTGKKDSNIWLDLIAKVTPYVFVAGLLLFSSSILTAICISRSPHLWGDYWDILWNSEQSVNGLFMQNTYFMSQVSPTIFVYVFLVSVFLFALLSWRVDINIFSMHLLYRNRLVRCYLGASNEARNPHPFHGFDPSDDLKLNDISSSNSYNGPYPIVNTAINLVGGKELAWQQRKAASFSFTPKFSGYEVIKAKKKVAQDGLRLINTMESGYRPTADYAGKNGVMLGEAMAISGAAASPNMGYHTSRPLAFLMTVFNVRLGWWTGNTRYQTWGKKDAPWGIWYLFAELFGLTRDDKKYVYLSDGGHFENLGIYELIRRRCRVILLCDAGCDPEYTFGDLGNAIRKIRVDFGVTIDMDQGQLKELATGKRHYAIGTIIYPGSECNDDRKGTLIYIKPAVCVCGEEPSDVTSYKATEKEFPHQSTADQWFDETQFEAYRMLGFHSLGKALGDDWKGKKIADLITG